MTSYKKLKENYLALIERCRDEEWKQQIYYNALMKIARLRGPDVVEGPLKAMDALIEAQRLNEEK